MMCRSDRGSENTELRHPPRVAHLRVSNPGHPAYSVFCPYCGAGKYEPCTHTMLPGFPILDVPHQIRVEYAEEINQG